MKTTVLNLALYQAGWFACVLGGAHGYPWQGAFAGLILLLVHLVLCREPGKEIKTVLVVAVVGTAADSIQSFFGVFVFLSGYWVQWVVPIWISVMWLQFATLLHFALGWLSGRYVLSAFLGAVGGPMAFFTGERLGAAIFPKGQVFSLLVLAVVWAVILPLSVFTGDRFMPVRKGYRIFGSSGRQHAG